jgi:hypothetical protein
MPGVHGVNAMCVKCFDTFPKKVSECGALSFLAKVFWKYADK